MVEMVKIKRKEDFEFVWVISIKKFVDNDGGYNNGYLEGGSVVYSREPEFGYATFEDALEALGKIYASMKGGDLMETLRKGGVSIYLVKSEK